MQQALVSKKVAACGKNRDRDLGGSSRGDLLLNTSVPVQESAKAEEVWDALSRVTTDHKTGNVVMTSKELQLACVWVLRGTVSSKAELESLEKCLTLLWADEAGRQLQHPEENLEHALAVSAACWRSGCRQCAKRCC